MALGSLRQFIGGVAPRSCSRVAPSNRRSKFVRDLHKRHLKQMSDLPDDAVVSIPVAAALMGVSTKTITRNFPLIKITRRLNGVSLGYLRSKAALATS